MGDEKVGKTSLIRRAVKRENEYSDGDVQGDYGMTTQEAVAVKAYPVSSAEATVELFIFDTPGNSLFSPPHNSSADLDFEGLTAPSVCLYVYDVTNRETFTSIARWITTVRSYNEGKPVVGVLLANKADMKDRKLEQVSKKEAVEFSTQHGLSFFETSVVHDAYDSRRVFDFITNAFWAKYLDERNRMAKLVERRSTFVRSPSTFGTAII